MHRLFTDTSEREKTVRIITGKARGTTLFTLEGEATRPTSERAKEAVFSMLQFDIEGRSALDLFGGSGQLGLEALSRGAATAVIADSSRAAVGIITQNAEKTRLASGCRIMCSDWSDSLHRLGNEKFDIVFLDPPYRMNIIPAVLEKLYPHLKPTSTVVCESGEDISEQLDRRYEIIKQSKYGVAYVMLVRVRKETEL